MHQLRRERREHPRRGLNCYLPIRVPGWLDYSVWGRDVSRGGIGLAVDRELKVGDRFLFAIDGQRQRFAEVCTVRREVDEPRFIVGLRWVDERGKQS